MFHRTFTAGAAMLVLGGLALAQEPAEKSGTASPPEYLQKFEDDAITGTTGEEIYANVCAGCHMSGGEGAVGAGAYPALSGNPNLEFPEYPIHIVINGAAGMPAFGHLMSDEQIVEVVNYIQSALGNDFEPTATLDAVEMTRPEEPTTDKEEH